MSDDRITGLFYTSVGVPAISVPVNNSHLFVGVPAISVPVKLSENGLPLSIQIISRHFEEETMLNAAQFIEKACNFPFLVNGIAS